MRLDEYVKKIAEAEDPKRKKYVMGLAKKHGEGWSDGCPQCDGHFHKIPNKLKTKVGPPKGVSRRAWGVCSDCGHEGGVDVYHGTAYPRY